MPDEVTRICPHCITMEDTGTSHSRNCHCTHHHADHIFGGGCKICKCDRYDQSDSSRVLKDKTAKVLGDALIDLNALAEESEDLKELVTAQARVDQLRIRKAELESDVDV